MPSPSGRPDAELLTPAEVAGLLKLDTKNPVATLRQWRCEGRGPDWIALTPRTIRYTRGAVERFLASRTCRAAESAFDHARAA